MCHHFVVNMPGGGILHRFQSGRGLHSRFEQQAKDLMLEGAKESLKGIDVNQLIRQGLDKGIDGIDQSAVKANAKTDFKRGIKRGVKRKLSQSLPGRAVKRVKDIFG